MREKKPFKVLAGLKKPSSSQGLNKVTISINSSTSFLGTSKLKGGIETRLVKKRLNHLHSKLGEVKTSRNDRLYNNGISFIINNERNETQRMISASSISNSQIRGFNKK